MGIKPTVGTVPTDGVVPVSSSQDSPGPMARTVRDAAALLGVLAGDGVDYASHAVDGRLAGVGERESVADVARVLGPQSAAVVWRTFEQSRIEEMAANAGVPVVNALTDDYHPCQVLADLLTVLEHRGETAAFILEQRLQQCKDALANPAQAHLTITEIAVAWGFNHPGNFTKAFRRRFGLPPRDWRAGRLAKPRSDR